MLKFFLFAVIIIGTLVESTATSFSFALIGILLFYVYTKSLYSFLIAFLAGLSLDIFSLRAIGLSSIYFIVFLFILNLYEKKFEINSSLFIFTFSFAGSLGFLFVSSENFIFLKALINSIFALILFNLASRINRGAERTGYKYG